MFPTSRRSPWHLFAAFVVTAGQFVTVAHAHADDSLDSNRALAADLFDAAVKKMDAGRCDVEGAVDISICNAARDELKRAFAVYPAGLGALRNLAYVERGLHLFASAARDFRELARRAPLDPDPKRRPWADFARKEAESLEPRVPHVTFTLAAPSPPDLVMTLDGSPVPRAAWGAKLDVDPGAHTVRAEAHGYAAFVSSFTLAEGDAQSIAVTLSSDTESAATAAPLESPPSRTRVAPIVVMSVGGAAVVTGLILGYVAIDKHKSACGDSQYCEPNELETGRTFAQSSTIVTSAGTAILAGGLLWFFLAPHGEVNSAARFIAPYASHDGAGLRAEGRF